MWKQMRKLKVEAPEVSVFFMEAEAKAEAVNMKWMKAEAVAEAVKNILEVSKQRLFYDEILL